MFVSSLISPKFYIPCSFPNIKFVPQSMFSCLIWMKCIAQGIIVRQKAKETITQGCVYVRVYLLNRVWLFATLWTVARQTPLSMGFFRQEYWSGLPRVLEWVAVSFSRRFCQPRDRTRVSRIAGRHFTVWATREVGCQFLLLRIFLTQGSNLCLLYFLHCSQILYLLSFGGSPILDEMQSQISVSRNKEKKSDSYSESSGGIGEEQICCDRDQEPFSCYFPISSSHVDDSYLTSTIIESKDPIFLE